MTSSSDEVSVALAVVERLYSEGLEQHGASPRSVGWKGRASQRLRFVELECAYFAFCKREISPYVTPVHDYSLGEWTMLVRHP